MIFVNFFVYSNINRKKANLIKSAYKNLRFIHNTNFIVIRTPSIENSGKNTRCDVPMHLHVMLSQYKVFYKISSLYKITSRSNVYIDVFNERFMSISCCAIVQIRMLFSVCSARQPENYLVKHETEPIISIKKIFFTYLILCHGEQMIMLDVHFLVWSQNLLRFSKPF